MGRQEGGVLAPRALRLPARRTPGLSALRKTRRWGTGVGLRRGLAGQLRRRGTHACPASVAAAQASRPGLTKPAKPLCQPAAPGGGWLGTSSASWPA